MAQVIDEKGKVVDKSTGNSSTQKATTTGSTTATNTITSIADAKAAWAKANAAGDTKGMEAAHAAAEAIRAQSGYSGGSDGSQHISLTDSSTDTNAAIAEKLSQKKTTQTTTPATTTPATTTPSTTTPSSTNGGGISNSGGSSAGGGTYTAKKTTTTDSATNANSAIQEKLAQKKAEEEAAAKKKAEEEAAAKKEAEEKAALAKAAAEEQERIKQETIARQQEEAARIAKLYAEQLLAEQKAADEEARKQGKYNITTDKTNAANNAGYYQGGGKYTTTNIPSTSTIIKDKTITNVGTDSSNDAQAMLDEKKTVKNYLGTNNATNAQPVSSTGSDDITNKAAGELFYKGGGKYDPQDKVYNLPDKYGTEDTEEPSDSDIYGDSGSGDDTNDTVNGENSDYDYGDYEYGDDYDDDYTTTTSGTISTDSLIQQIVDQLTGDESGLISPDVLTWAQAYAQALANLGGTYDASLQSALDELKTKALQSGFYGQANYDMMVAKAIQSGELEKNSAVASLAQELVGQSKEDAQNTIENWLENKQITIDGLYNLLALVAKYNSTTSSTTTNTDDEGNTSSSTTTTKTYM